MTKVNWEQWDYNEVVDLEGRKLSACCKICNRYLYSRAKNLLMWKMEAHERGHDKQDAQFSLIVKEGRD